MLLVIKPILLATLRQTFSVPSSFGVFLVLLVMEVRKFTHTKTKGFCGELRGKFVSTCMIFLKSLLMCNKTVW